MEKGNGCKATNATTCHLRSSPNGSGRIKATLVYFAGLFMVFLGLRSHRHLMAFLGSSAFILGLMAASAASVFPVMLRSTLNPEWSLTAHNASVAASGLRKGFARWIIAFPIALGYFAQLPGFWSTKRVRAKRFLGRHLPPKWTATSRERTNEV